VYICTSDILKMKLEYKPRDIDSIELEVKTPNQLGSLKLDVTYLFDEYHHSILKRNYSFYQMVNFIQFFG